MSLGVAGWSGEPLDAEAEGFAPRGKLHTIAVNGPEGILDWDAIDWRIHEQNVVRLRRRIVKATSPRGLFEPWCGESPLARF
ncbi:hypothetical protein [Nonomuraea sp. SYSU D8015]|uniref:hypothetical protein n=1 Tax=Nonomuraea sp. SYSU D8015 TaxID=2593644 RepID=UPI00166013DD|nr:hypothetical protein [Nonomuraea sp. SYSU D8015]